MRQMTVQSLTSQPTITDKEQCPPVNLWADYICSY